MASELFKIGDVVLFYSRHLGTVYAIVIGFDSHFPDLVRILRKSRKTGRLYQELRHYGWLTLVENLETIEKVRKQFKWKPKK